MGQGVLVAWVWLAAATFVAGCAWRAWRYRRAPVHLRWDLYPVAHEPAARRAYGGSRLEDPEYWTRGGRRSLAGELEAVLAEAVLFRGVWRNNRRVFWASLPFHWGLYLLVATSGLLAASSILAASSWAIGLARLSGIAGGLLVAAGALGLLALRTADPGLKRYSSPLDRLNLGAFAAVGGLGAAVALRPGGMEAVSRAVGALLAFRSPEAPALVAAHMALAGLVLFYFPFTRMVHFFAKYFLYHDVRWDDRAVVAGSAMERRLRGALDFGISWSADHVGSGRTWREVAADGRAREERRQ